MILVNIGSNIFNIRDKRGYIVYLDKDKTVDVQDGLGEKLIKMYPGSLKEVVKPKPKYEEIKKEEVVEKKEKIKEETPKTEKLKEIVENINNKKKK